MIWSVLIDAMEGNVVFHLKATSVEVFDDYTIVVDGIELRTKDRIIDVISTIDDENLGW